ASLQGTLLRIHDFENDYLVMTTTAIYFHHQIVPLPHARSEVWTYFGFVADQDGQILDRSKVVCRLCSSSFCYSGNTTNFYSHLKSMHSEIQMRSVPSKNARVSVKR